MPAYPLTLRFGKLKTDGFVVSAQGSYSGVVSVYVDDDYKGDITLTKVGDDRTTADQNGDLFAFWHGTMQISGLNPDTEYVVRGVQSTRSYQIYPRTLPDNKGSKIAIAPATCFAPRMTREDGVTGFDMLKAYMQNPDNPRVYVIPWLDDIYYAAGGHTNIDAGMVNAEGKIYDSEATGVFNSKNERLQYGYAINYGIWFGIFSAFYSTADTGKTDPRADAALSPAFQWVMDRVAFMPQWGDWEFWQNINWNNSSLGANTTDQFPNAFHKTDPALGGGWDGNAYLTYKQLMMPFQGTAIKDEAGSLDTEANHWYADFGAMRWIALDPITQARRDYTNDIQTAAFGNNQIDDALNVIDSGDQWFTGVGNPAVAGRGYPTFSTVSGNPGYKSEQDVIAEYNRLWLNSGQTPKSIMDNSKSNGRMGSAVMFRGDWHIAPWLYWSAPAGSGLLAEEINEIGLATVNSSPGSTVSWDADLTGLSAENCELVGAASSLVALTKSNVTRMTICVIDGTASTPEMVIDSWELAQESGKTDESAFVVSNVPDEFIIDENKNKWKLLGNKVFPLYAGNKGYTKTETKWQITKTNSDNGSL